LLGCGPTLRRPVARARSIRAGPRRKLRPTSNVSKAVGLPRDAPRRWRATKVDYGRRARQRLRYVGRRETGQDAVEAKWHEIIGVVSDFPAKPTEPDALRAMIYHLIAEVKWPG